MFFKFFLFKQMSCYLKGRFRSVNQGLNNEGRCCEVHAQTLLKIPTLAATAWLLMRYASVTTSKNKKLLKIPNSSIMIILYTDRFEILCRTIFYFLPPNSFSFPSSHEKLNVDQVLVCLFLDEN